MTLKKKLFKIILVGVLLLAVAGVCLFLFFKRQSGAEGEVSRLLDEAVELSSADSRDADHAKAFKRMREHLPADTVVYNSVRDYAQDLMMDGRQADVFELLARAIRICEDSGNPGCRKFVLDSYVLIGASADEIGMSNLSIEYYVRGIKLANEFGNETALARLYNNLGVCYFHIDDLDKSEEYFSNSLRLNKKLGRNYDTFLNYNNLSEISLNRGDLDDALDKALMALQYLDGVDDSNKLKAGQIYYIQSQIANIYVKKQDWAMARSYLENAIRQLRKSGLKNELFSSCMIYSDLLRQTDEVDSALTWCTEAYNVIVGQGNLLMESQALEQMSLLERERGDESRSLEYLTQVLALKDSVQQAENRNRMEQSQKVWKTERSNFGGQSFLARQNPVTVFTVFSVIVLALIIFMVIWALEKRKLSRALKAKDDLDSRIARMHDEQLAEAASKQEELRQSLDLSNRQLTAFTMQKIRFSEQQNDILEDVRRLFAENSPRSKEMQAGLQRIISKLSGFKANDDWKEFRYYFENVNTDFYARLMKTHPDLTEKQKRLCALLYLGLNTKEISSISFREVRSIESSRARLRKKLGLSGDEDLNLYFQRFSSHYDTTEPEGNRSGNE